MAECVVRVGSFSAQGIRPNNEDRFVVDQEHKIYLVADGMGGMECGEQASGLAAEIIPRAVQDRLAANEDASQAVLKALEEANQAIIDAGRHQPENRRMGTTAVLALQRADQVFIASLGDSRAYLIRDERVEQLTVDDSVAQALVSGGVLTPEEARHSPWQHVLHKFLGCVNMTDETEVRPFVPQVGDRLVLGSDGLTNHITEAELRDGPKNFPHPQSWAEHLGKLALQHGSQDNVTCVVLAFEKE